MAAEESPHRTVEIDVIEVERGEGTLDSAASGTLESLFVRWLVRAYVRRYGNGGENDSRSVHAREEVSPLALQA